METKAVAQSPVRTILIAAKGNALWYEARSVVKDNAEQ